MIHYQLRCSQGHEFDGWFRDSAAFDGQAGRGLLTCPECGDASVGRALMAPAVPRKRRDAPPRAAVPPETKEPDTKGPAPAAPGAVAVTPPPQLPDQVRAMLQRLRAEVEKQCDYVGPEFADEARRIHRGDADARGIYGETTPEQAEALAEEGIEVARIPWVPRADG